MSTVAILSKALNFPFLSMSLAFADIFLVSVLEIYSSVKNDDT